VLADAQAALREVVAAGEDVGAPVPELDASTLRESERERENARSEGGEEGAAPMQYQLYSVMVHRFAPLLLGTPRAHEAAQGGFMRGLRAAAGARLADTTTPTSARSRIRGPCFSLKTPSFGPRT
jgi:hypothetical protein